MKKPRILDKTPIINSILEEKVGSKTKIEPTVNPIMQKKVDA